MEFPSASQNLEPALPLEEQSELEVPGGVMLLLTGRMGGLDDANGGSTGGSGMATRDVNVQSTIAWNYDGRECRVEPMGVGDSIGWLIVVSVACFHSVFISFYVTFASIGVER